MALRDISKYFLYRYTVQKGIEMVRFKRKQLATVHSCCHLSIGDRQVGRKTDS